MHENFWIAFGLTVFAGLSTGIGSSIVFVAKRKNTQLLTFSMGLAAGVMIYISFMEIMPHAMEALGHDRYIGVLSFFVGMLLVVLIDKVVPQHDSPHEIMSDAEQIEADADLEQLRQGHSEAISDRGKKRLMRLGFLTAMALALHNFPEGMATFVSALNDIPLGITIAFAIALHNIPEGISVAMPIYYATGDRRKAFWYSFVSGVMEPLGALIAYLLLMNFLDAWLMSILLSGVAGIMVFISLDQLLPASREYGGHQVSIYGVLVGMAIMALSLSLLNHQH